MSSLIGYANLLNNSAAVITASSEAAGFGKENAYDLLLADWWKPTAAGTHTLIVDLGSAMSADYFACMGHTLAENSGNIRLFYSDTGTSGPWTGAFAAVTPSSTEPIFKSFDSLSKRYWKIEIQDSGSPSVISDVRFGEALTLPQGLVFGFVPPVYHFADEVTNMQTESGNYLIGTVKNRGLNFTIEMPPVLLEAFITGDYLTFLNFCNIGKPFFFAWDYTNHPTQITYCNVRNVTPVTYSNHLHLHHKIQVRGLIK